MSNLFFFALLHLLTMACHRALPHHHMGNTCSSDQHRSSNLSTSSGEVTMGATSSAIKNGMCYLCQREFDLDATQPTSTWPCGHRFHTHCMDCMTNRDYDPKGIMKTVDPPCHNVIAMPLNEMTSMSIQDELTLYACPRCAHTFMDKHDYWPFLVAIAREDIGAMQTYLAQRSHEEINRTDKSKNSFLMMASKWGKIESVRCLLHHAADALHANQYGYKAIDYAPSHDHTILELLLKYNISYDASVSDYTSTLPGIPSPQSTLYMDEQRPQSIDLLQNIPSHIRCMDEQLRQFTLHEASSPTHPCMRQQFKQFSRLTQQAPTFVHPSIGIKKQKKQAPFAKKVMQWLKEELLITSQDECTIYQKLRAAIRKFDHGLLDNIMQLYRKWPNHIALDLRTSNCLATVAIHVNNARALCLLLEQGANPNGPGIGIRDTTLLHQAIIDNSLSCTALLLSHKDIIVNASNIKGDTPLHLASRHGRTEMVHLLLRHNDIQINIRNNDGIPPLYETFPSIDHLCLFAASMIELEDNPCAEVLMAHGAQIG